MFGKTSKDGASENERAATSAPAPARPSQPLSFSQPSSAEATNDVSSISPGMTIVGKISGDGTVKVFGRIEGELRASIVLVAEGAQVEGDIVAEDLTVGGRVKGTVHANRVKLNSSAAVEGDIFHRSLSIEENARFEGSSRREDTVLETPRLPLTSRPPSQATQSSSAAVDPGPRLNGAPDNGAHAKPAA